MNSNDQPINTDAESPFHIQELFFSRTDDRGVILAGNSVFQRVSNYSWDELVNSPHKLIRHPDMPKAVFYLLWATIKAGMPVGAYVKNRTKDGRYYWVFAFVTPVPDGYLSVRLKPTSPLFAAVQEEYRKLRKLERDTGMSAEESAKALLDRLTELGWRNYAAFLADAATQEIKTRDHALLGSEREFSTATRRIIESSSENLKNAERVLSLCEKLKYSAINLGIHSAKNSAHRHIFGAISQNFERVSIQLRGKVETFIKVAEDAADMVNTGIFELITAGTQHEMSQVFWSEAEIDSGVDQMLEAERLHRQSREYTEHAKNSLRTMRKEIELFKWHCSEMVEQVSTLGATGSIGLIETGRLDKGGAEAFHLLEETSAIQREIENILTLILTRNAQLVLDVVTVNSLRESDPEDRAGAA